MVFCWVLICVVFGWFALCLLLTEAFDFLRLDDYFYKCGLMCGCCFTWVLFCGYFYLLVVTV